MIRPRASGLGFKGREALGILWLVQGKPGRSRFPASFGRGLAQSSGSLPPGELGVLGRAPHEWGHGMRARCWLRGLRAGVVVLTLLSSLSSRLCHSPHHG